METESEGHLPFLDIDTYRRPDGSLGHRVYHKATHTNLYLNAGSHHHPSSKQAVLSTLVTRARAVCCGDSLHVELVFLRDVRQNGYNDQQIHRVLNHCPNISQPDNNPDSVTFLSYVQPIFNQISRVLSRHNIKSVGLPLEKVSSFLWPFKDNLGLRTAGVYRIPCEGVYIGQTGRSMDTRLKEHQRHFHLEHPDKAAMAEHSVDLGHCIQFHNTSIFATKTRYMDRNIRGPLRLSSIPTI
jgi:hypothetical protein